MKEDGTSQVSKSQRNQDRSSLEDAWQQSSAIGESSDRRSSSVNRDSEYREFRGHKIFPFRNRKPRNPERRKEPSWGPAVSILEKWEVSFKGPTVSVAKNRDSRSRNPVGICILALETLKPRRGIRLRSWEKWSYGPGA
jgi:hypothetical protein